MTALVNILFDVAHHICGLRDRVAFPAFYDTLASLLLGAASKNPSEAAQSAEPKATDDCHEGMNQARPIYLLDVCRHLQRIRLLPQVSRDLDAKPTHRSVQI